MDSLPPHLVSFICGKVDSLSALDALRAASRRYRDIIAEYRQNIIEAWMIDATIWTERSQRHSKPTSHVQRHPYDVHWFCKLPADEAYNIMTKAIDRGSFPFALAPDTDSSIVKDSWASACVRQDYWTLFKRRLFMGALRCQHIDIANAIFACCDGVMKVRLITDAANANVGYNLPCTSKMLVDHLLYKHIVQYPLEGLLKHRDCFLRVAILSDARESFLALLTEIPDAANRTVFLVDMARVAYHAWPGQVAKPEYILMVSFIVHVLSTTLEEDTNGTMQTVLSNKLREIRAYISDKIRGHGIDEQLTRAATISASGVVEEWRVLLQNAKHKGLSDYLLKSIEKRCAYRTALDTDLVLWATSVQRGANSLQYAPAIQHDAMLYLLACGRIYQAVAMAGAYPCTVLLNFNEDRNVKMVNNAILGLLCARTLSSEDLKLLKQSYFFMSVYDWGSWNRLVCKTSNILIQASRAPQPLWQSVCGISGSMEHAALNLSALSPSICELAKGSLAYHMQPRERTWATMALLFRMRALSIQELRPLWSCTQHFVNPVALMSMTSGMVDEDSPLQMSALWTLASARRVYIASNAYDIIHPCCPLSAAVSLAFRLHDSSALLEYLQHARKVLDTETVACIYRALEECSKGILTIIGCVAQQDPNGCLCRLTELCKLVTTLSSHVIDIDEYRVLRGIIRLALLLEKKNLTIYSNMLMAHAHLLSASKREWNLDVSSNIVRTVVFDVWHSV